MPGTDGRGGTLDGGCLGELIPDRKVFSCCVLGDGGTTTKTKPIVSYHWLIDKFRLHHSDKPFFHDGVKQYKTHTRAATLN